MFKPLRHRAPKPAGLLLLAVLSLGGCVDTEAPGPLPPPPPPPVTPAPTPPSPPPTPPSAPEPAPVASAGPVSQSGSLTLEQQDGRSSAGSQVSTTPNFTLISEGVSP